MANNVYEESAKRSFALIEFEYGPLDDPLYARFTDWTTDPQSFGFSWTAQPAIEFRDAPTDTGGMEDPSITVNFPLIEGGFIETISEGAAVSLIKTKIWVGFLSDDSTLSSQPQLIFFGYLNRARRYPNGEPEVVQLELNNWKVRVGQPMGIPANVQCGWTFGDQKTCQFALSAEVETGSLTAISGFSVTITGLADHSTGPFASTQYWRRGYIYDETDGIRVPIFDWDPSAPTIFKLRRRPPAWSTPRSVLVTPGCDKTYPRCQEWGQEDRFMAPGFGLPAYDPRFDNPSGT